MLSYLYRLENLQTGEYVDINAAPTAATQGAQPTGIILQQYPAFDLEVRSTEKTKSGQHGIWDFYSFYGKRTVSLQGIIVQTSHAAVYALQNKLRRILCLPAHPSLTNDGYIKISWTDDNGVEWAVRGKIQQDVQFRRQLKNVNMSDFFFSFKCENPYILSTTLHTEVGLMGWRQGALFSPTFLPDNINVLYNNILQFYQKGTSEGPAVFRLYGDAVDPKITRFTEDVSDKTVISDFTSGWVGGTSDTVNFLTPSEGRKLTSTNGVASSMSLAGSFDFNYDSDFTEELTIHSFDDLTSDGDVVGSDDATNLTVDYVVKQEGNASIKFDIDSTLSGSTYGDVGVSNMSPKDFVSHVAGGYIRGRVFLSDASKISSLDLLIGSSGGSNYSTGNITLDENGNAFANGWNVVKILYSALTNVGTGADYSQIDYFHVRYNETGLVGTVTDFRIDGFTSTRQIKREWISFYAYIDSVDNMEIGDYTAGTNYIKFIETAGVDEFVIQMSQANLTLRDGWNYIRILKDQCTVIGNPSWDDIVSIELKIKSRSGTTLNVTFDDLVVKNIEFLEQKMEFSYTIPAGSYIEIDTAEGTLKLDGTTDLSPYLSSDSEWFGTLAGENSFIYESDTNPLITYVYPTQRFEIDWNDAML